MWPLTLWTVWSNSCVSYVTNLTLIRNGVGMERKQLREWYQVKKKKRGGERDRREIRNFIFRDFYYDLWVWFTSTGKKKITSGRRDVDTLYVCRTWEPLSDLKFNIFQNKSLHLLDLARFLPPLRKRFSKPFRKFTGAGSSSNFPSNDFEPNVVDFRSEIVSEKEDSRPAEAWELSRLWYPGFSPF